MSFSSSNSALIRLLDMISSLKLPHRMNWYFFLWKSTSHLKHRCVVGHVYKNFKSLSATYHFSGTVFCVSNKNNKIFVKAPIKIVPQNRIILDFQTWNYLTEWIDIFFLWKSTSHQKRRYAVGHVYKNFNSCFTTYHFSPIVRTALCVFFHSKNLGPLNSHDF